MCVNDLACTGAQPLVFLDYLAVGPPRPRRGGGAGALDRRRLRRRRVRPGRRRDRRDAGALRAGPLRPGRASPPGWSSAPRCSGPHRVREGDAIVGIPSSGLHSNGFSLVRALVAAGALAADPDLLLAPTRLYVREIAAMRGGRRDVHAAAHITGGGLPENLPRALPEGLGADLDRGVVGAGAGDRRRPRHRPGGRGGGVAHLQHGPRHVRRRGRTATRRGGRRRRRRAPWWAGWRRAAGRRAVAEPLPRGACSCRAAGSNLQSLIDTVHEPGGPSRSCGW